MVFEIKMTRDIANSIPAFYAADAGAERCLYQARCGLLSPTLTECTDQIGMSKNQGCAVVPGSIAVYGLSNSASVNQALRTAANQITSKGIFSGTNRKVEINW